MRPEVWTPATPTRLWGCATVCLVTSAWSKVTARMPRVVATVLNFVLFRLTALFVVGALIVAFGSVIGFAEAEGVGDYVEAVIGVALAVLLAALAAWTWRERDRRNA